MLQIRYCVCERFHTQCIFLHVDVAIRVAIHPSDVFPSPQVDVDDLEDIAATAGINSMPTPTAWPPSGAQAL